MQDKRKLLELTNGAKIMTQKEILDNMLKNNSGKDSEWIHDDTYDLTYCRECKQCTFVKIQYCPWCGAKMKNAETDEAEYNSDKTAEWVKGYYFNTCSLCDHVGMHVTPFCGHCGAKMGNWHTAKNGFERRS